MVDESVEVKPKTRRINRRQFIKLAAGALASATIPGCVNQEPPSPEVTADIPEPEAGETEVEKVEIQTPQVSEASAEIVTQKFVENVIVNYNRMLQEVTWEIDPETGEKRLPLSCSGPYSSENREGFTPEDIENPWKLDKLKRVNIRGASYAILTPQNPSDINTESIQRLHENSERAVENVKDIGKQNPTESAIIVRESTKNRYYVIDGNATSLVDDKTNSTDADISNAVTTAIETLNIIKEESGGRISFTVANENILALKEDDMPLTSDPQKSFQTLIDNYSRSVPYDEIAQRAQELGVKCVFFMGTGDCGMYESVVYGGIKIFGLNADRGIEEAMETFCHDIEYLSELGNERGEISSAFTSWCGPQTNYDIYPLFEQEQLREEVINDFNAKGNTVYVAPNYGLTHLPPNARFQHDYSCDIRVIIPGNVEPVNSYDEWGGTRLGYYKWWIKHLHPKFLNYYAGNIGVI